MTVTRVLDELCDGDNIVAVTEEFATLVGMDARELRADYRRGRALNAALPGTKAAFEDKNLSQAQADTILKGCKNLDPAESAAVQREMTEKAQEFHGRAFAKETGDAINRIAPRSIKPRKAQAHANRRAKFYADDVAKESVFTMVGPMNDMVALENALTSVVKDNHDRRLDAGMLPQEMYDTALAVLTGKSAINPGQPAIVVTVSAESLLSLSDKPARVVDGDVLTAGEMLNFFATATIQALLLDEQGNPQTLTHQLNFGKTQRFFDQHQKLAMQAMSNRCAEKSCTNPARLGEADHVKEWADGGDTNITNAQPLCSLHHAMKTARHNHRRAA
jgi:hypothetical protein